MNWQLCWPSYVQAKEIWLIRIVTKLLVADGDIVVIGGIKKNVLSKSKDQVPAIGNMPVIGNLFKGTENSDNLDELLVFIAPRIL